MSFLFDYGGNRKYLTAFERSAFLSAAARRPAEVRTFCRVLAYSGARISEILALTPQQIDISAQVIIIECLKKRRRGVFRAIPIPPDLLNELDQVHGIRKVQRDPARATKRVWEWCRTTAWHHVKDCMEEAKISGRQAMPKGLRHGFGVAVLQSGVPINLLKKWLGHSRLSTTEIYAEAVGAEERAMAEKFWQTVEKSGAALGTENAKKVLGREDDDAVVASEREQILVPGDQKISLGRDGAGQNHVVVGITDHPDLRDFREYLTGKPGQLAAVVHDIFVGVLVPFAQSPAGEEHLGRLLKDVIGQHEVERAGSGLPEQIV